MRRKIADIALFSGGAVILGVLVSAVLLSFIGVNPFAVISEAFVKVISDKYTFGEVLVKATPLILTALAFALTYKANLFNIGAQGQFYMGSIVAVALSLTLGKSLPGPLVLLCVIIGTFAAGALIGSLIGLAKAKFNSNEFLVSMMSTYVISAFMDYLLRTVLRETKGEYLQTDAIPASTYLPKVIPGTRIHLGFFIAVAAAIAVWYFLQRTPLGFRIRAVGHNRQAAHIGGINTKKKFIIAFAISGGLAGLAGLTEINGVQHMLLQNFNSTIGASGIGIAILANGHPIGIIFASILFGGLSVIGSTMGRMGLNIPASIIDLMQGVVMICVIISYFFKKRVEIRREKKELLKAGDLK